MGGFWLLIQGVGMGGGSVPFAAGPLYRPNTAAGPDAYRPGAGVPPSAYNPSRAAGPGEYRPTNPSTPGG